MLKSLKIVTVLGAFAMSVSPVNSQTADTDPAVFPLPDLNTKWQGAWRLRGALDIPTTIGGFAETDAELKANRIASPFVLSYEHDALTDETSTHLKGALFYEFGRDVDDGSRLKIIKYAAGVTLDQSSVNGVQMTDTIGVETRMAALFTNSDVGARINNHFVTGGIGWLTDSDFDLSVLTVDAAYTPITADFGHIGPRTGFQIQATPSLAIEGQKVFEAAGLTHFEGEADRLFAGVKIDVTAGFGSVSKEAKNPLSRLSFGLKYTQMYDLTGQHDDLSLLDATANWALTDDGAASLVINYQKGQSTSAAEIDKVTVGLGFAF
ncbi:MAG: hypothetical protein AB8B71_15025 [Paracoccaceae bacterium]